MTKEEQAIEFIGGMEQFIKLRTSMFNDDIDSIITSKAIPFVLAHDDAIRREACRAIRAEFKVSEGGSDTIDRACASILATEPAREES